MGRQQNKRGRQSGFSLIEAMIAMVLLAFGMLALISVYTQGIFFSSMAQWDYIAQKKAEEAVETIFTARDTQLLTWVQIQNVVDGGVFVDGASPMLVPGPDGLVGTQNDAGAAQDTVVVGPGPDGILGTADDDLVYLSASMTRTIRITPVPNEPNLRQITVTIQYKAGGRQKTHTLICYISAFA